MKKLENLHQRVSLKSKSTIVAQTEYASKVSVFQRDFFQAWSEFNSLVSKYARQSRASHFWAEYFGLILIKHTSILNFKLLHTYTNYIHSWNYTVQLLNLGFVSGVYFWRKHPNDSHFLWFTSCHEAVSEIVKWILFGLIMNWRWVQMMKAMGIQHTGADKSQSL